jgi:hypothetical protein
MASGRMPRKVDLSRSGERILERSGGQGTLVKILAPKSGLPGPPARPN